MEGHKLREIRSEAKKFFGDVDPSHDWQHVVRVEKLAEKIAEKEEADREIVKAAALLHDIGRNKEDEGEIEEHAGWGAEKAGDLLRDIGVAEEEIEKIQHCIRSHRYSKNLKPETVEAKVLNDADNLDALGATGVARTFSVAGERKNPLADPERPIGEDETEAGETALNHFYKKILTLKDRMYTESGKEIADDRHKFTEKFVERMGKEIRGEK